MLDIKEYLKQTKTVLLTQDAFDELMQRASAQPETHEERTETHACDCISRQAVIEINRSYHGQMPNEVNHRIWKEINVLPPAQPDLSRGKAEAQDEIVRCKDCKHRDPEDKKCDCGHAILWQLPRQDDWYCADAERRTDG